MVMPQLVSIMRFSSIWMWLTAPATTIERPDQRRQARFLAAFLLALLVFGLIWEYVVHLFIEDGLSPVGQVYTFTPILGLASLGYTLSRTKFYTTGAIIGGLAFSVAVLWRFIHADAPDISMLDYLVIPVLLCSTFVSMRMMATVAAANLTVIVFLSLWLPETNLGGYPITFFILVTVLMLFAAYHRNVLEQVRRAELAESEERYRTLSETVFEGIALVDDDIIQTANTGFVRILGYTKAQVMGKPALPICR